MNGPNRQKPRLDGFAVLNRAGALHLTGLALTAYPVRYHGLGIKEASGEVRGVRPIAMTAPGYEATARRFAELEAERMGQ
jgi:hypothetical protein